jgi:homoserine dehydrogenase
MVTVVVHVIRRPGMSGSIGRSAGPVKRHQASLCFRNDHKFDAGSGAPTQWVIHDMAIQPSAPNAPARSTRCRVALLGFGTVGRSVARILCEQPPVGVELTHIFNRGVARKRVDWVPATVAWTEDIGEVLASPADIIVELVGGTDPAGPWVERALDAGKSVVTANKQLIAHRGGALQTRAREHRCQLRFEGSVAGGIPIIAALREGLAGDHISRVLGILNGTCNYILTSMADGSAAFSDALRQAQELGYAEADPSDDVEGYDARAKLAILCAAALRADVQPERIATRSITGVEAVDFEHARQLGCTIRQVSHAEWDHQGWLHAVVRPTLVSCDSALARVAGSQNIVVLRGQYGGETVFSGSGAGGGPTSVAVVSDISAISRQAPAHEESVALRNPARVSGEFVTPHYLRFVVRDRPGIIARIAGVMEQHDINIDAVLQLPYPTKDALPFVVTVEACPPSIIAEAMRHIAAFDFHVQPPVDLPMLDGASA